MQGKNLLTLLCLFLFLIFQQTAFSQVNCSGKKIFSEKSCLGDDVNQQEKELFQIVNDYRAQNKLPPIPISNSLSIVANRHVIDLNTNLKALTHGWSNCPYDVDNKTTWGCVLESPKRLNVGYPGNGYENLFRKNGGIATPVQALEAWKKSEMHNALILNLNFWKDTQFDAFGIAISGEYAALWFGSSGSATNDFGSSISKGLGVTFEKAVKGLTNVMSIQKSASGFGGDQWVGASADKSIMLTVAGTEKDVSEATISMKIKLEKNAQLSNKNKSVLSTFLNNLAAEWVGREVWANSTLKALQQNPKAAESVTRGSKIISMSFDAENYLIINVKPVKEAKKLAVKEIK